ncbi:hypothetical protein CWN70_11385 [Klebsiella pneumoniae]|nr:hypothetical protein CI646_17845 [Klebsiella pneumoniae subsp. pneumoniae]OZJ74670.1 hypothetical protein CEO93_15645 [Klebsiella pneumoniae]OZJ91538.1 hypothetical protein CEO90_15640 [Klebsiella pneumoniae]OZJ96934.1 hypothetical protein CEO89_15650 [Klebsiella pneumoniae]OZK07621.1 hypothetical protein CEO87_15635 [Klebsiella pneumoniae]
MCRWWATIWGRGVMCYARWGMKEIFTLFRHKIYYYCLISFEKLSLPNKITVYMITFIIKGEFND